MRLIFLSSVGAVASTSALPLTEATEPRPTTDYGRSKLAAERGIVQALRGTAVDWTILRPTLVYGEGDPGNLPRLGRLVRGPWPLPLGAAKGRRSLLYVGNLVDAIALCLTSKAAARRTYFVADDEQVDLRELLLSIGRATGASPTVMDVPLPVLRVCALLFEGVSRLSGRSIGLDRYALERLLGSLVVDTTPIRKEIGWHPPHTLESGLIATFRDAG